MYTWKVDETSSGQRLDVFVARQLPELSRSSIQKLSEDKKVLVDTKPEKPSYKLKEGQKVKFNYDLGKLQDIPLINLPILYEDDDCLVINKPIGVLTHSKGAFNPEGTVATFIAPKLNKEFSGERAGIAHRLDRATSGVIICAKTPEALIWIQKQFSQRKVKKSYQAVVPGSLKPAEAIIDAPIERNPKKPQTFRVNANGKEAITEYHTLKISSDYSLLELLPRTGRTHQLRVHLKHIGEPIVGDTLYDGQVADRLYLHAYKLELTLPNRQRKVFTAPIPKEFNVIMK